ncbi:EndoU domain-containing protein [Actinomadura sp. KC216]|uniref:EndoU domain-containing protein n=1 Tax=Actinomadura sp. KC216 TaxID=2530370 RepID=UPI001404EC20|nr:EndoU domain-containing protein [Actinomadura sp. KC216]
MGRRPRGAARGAARQLGLLKPIEKWLLKRIERPRYQHIFLGNVNRRANKGTGFHHRYQGKNPPTARVRRDANGNELKDPPNSHGAYRAKVDVRDEDGTWYRKNGKSSFFPDSWTPKQVDEAINTAFKNATPDPANPNKWVGNLPNGMQIQGFYSGNLKKGWYSAWPVV